MANLSKLFRAAEADMIKAINFTDAFHDYIDGTMYQGYHQDLADYNLTAYEYEFSQFLKNYGDDTGEVLELCKA